MVYLLGCDHYLQEYNLGESNAEVRQIEHDLKNTFYSVIERIVQTHKIDFVGEECKPTQATIARAVAIELGCSYAEIDMPAAERERNEIAKDYQRRQDEEARGYALREQFMLERVYLESTTAQRKLIICGAVHLARLADRFRERGEEVIVQDVTAESWLTSAYERRFKILIG